MPTKFKKIKRLIATDYVSFNGKCIPTRFEVMQTYIPVGYISIPVLYKIK